MADEIHRTNSPSLSSLSKDDVLTFVDEVPTVHSSGKGLKRVVSIKTVSPKASVNAKMKFPPKDAADNRENQNHGNRWMNPLNSGIGHPRQLLKPMAPMVVDNDESQHITQSAEITQAEYNNFHRMFNAYDADGSGNIDADELGQIMQGLGVPMSAQELQKLIVEALGDTSSVDGEGLAIEFPEFVELMARNKERLMKDNATNSVSEKYIQDTLQTRFFLADSNTRWAVDLILMISISYYSITVTLRFIYDLPEYFINLEYVIHIFFFFDIMLRFCTIPVAPSIENEEVDDPLSMTLQQLSRHYALTYFTLDVVTSLPLELWSAHGSTSSKAFRILKLLKILRMPSLFQSSGGLRKITPTYINILYSWIPLMKLFMGLVFLIHWASVIWMAIESDESEIGNFENGEKEDLGDRYLRAVYVVLYTITTVGYGDVKIVTKGQRLIACLLFVVGAVINGFVVSKINRVLSQSDITSERKAKMVEMVNILSFFRIPSAIQHEILAFQHHILDHNLSSAYSEIIDALPTNMQDQLSLYVKLKLVSKVPLFVQVHDECKVAIAQALCNTVAQPNEFIICAGEIGNEMYFLGHGVAEVLQATGQHLATMKKGQFFGEMALIYARDGISKRTASVRALTYCDLYCLRKEDFLDILSRFPKFRQVVDKEAATRRKLAVPAEVTSGSDDGGKRRRVVSTCSTSSVQDVVDYGNTGQQRSVNPPPLGELKLKRKGNNGNASPVASTSSKNIGETFAELLRKPSMDSRLTESPHAHHLQELQDRLEQHMTTTQESFASLESLLRDIARGITTEQHSKEIGNRRQSLSEHRRVQLECDPHERITRIRGGSIMKRVEGQW